MKIIAALFATALTISPFCQAVVPASAAETASPCTVVDVTGSVARVHIRCSNNLGGGIYYVAAPNTDAEMANRLLMLGTSALIYPNNLWVVFDLADNSGAAYGCSLGDCRPAIAVSLRP